MDKILEFIEISKKVIPSTKDIFKETIMSLGFENRSELYIRENFELLLKESMNKGLELLNAAQIEAQKIFLTSLAKSRAKEFEEIAEKILSNALKEGSALEKLSMLIIQATTDFPPLQAFYTSMSNMRKSRAGSHFQRSVEYLLRRCDINSERGKKPLARADLVIPNHETFYKHPEKSILLELKHTMRERWKSATIEKFRTTHTVWIVTLDEKFGKETIEEIEDMGLFVYTPESFWKRHEEERSVRKLSELVGNIEGVIPTPKQRKLR